MAAALCIAVMLAVLASCSPEPRPAPGNDWPVCNSPAGFSVRYPATWFVHPVDASIGVEQCHLFALEPFSATKDETGNWDGAQIVLTMGSGCRGSFEVALSERATRIDGFPAWARELAPGEGPGVGEVSGYAYFLNLDPEKACEEGRWFVGRTDPHAPGDFDLNKQVLDLMMMTVTFNR